MFFRRQILQQTDSLNTGKSSVQIKTTDSVDLQETASDDSTADKVLSDSENGTVGQQWLRLPCLL